MQYRSSGPDCHMVLISYLNETITPLTNTTPITLSYWHVCVKLMSWATNIKH